MRRKRTTRAAADPAWLSAVGPGLAKGILSLFFVTVAVVNTSDIAWPAVSWPMFSQRVVDYPGDVYEADLFKAIDASGQGFWIRSSNLWGNDRYQIGDKMIARSLDTNHPRCAIHRSAVIKLIRFEYPQHEIERVEIWHLTWDVDLDSVPALIFDAPRGTRLLASFTEDKLMPEGSSEGDK